MFELYEPENKIPGVQYLFDKELNVDWYEYMHTLNNELVKITVDGDNVVRQCTSDVYSIFPVNCKIITLDKNVSIPSDITENIYKFIGNKFIPFISEVDERKNMDLIFKKAFYYSIKEKLTKEQKSEYEELKNEIIKYGDDKF